MDHEFRGRVVEWRGPPPYLFVPLPDEVAAQVHDVAREASYGWGCIPVQARADGVAFTTSLFPRHGGYLLPLKAAVRRPARLDLGDDVDVGLTVQLPTRRR